MKPLLSPSTQLDLSTFFGKLWLVRMCPDCRVTNGESLRSFLRSEPLCWRLWDVSTGQGWPSRAVWYARLCHVQSRSIISEWRKAMAHCGQVGLYTFHRRARSCLRRLNSCMKGEVSQCPSPVAPAHVESVYPCTKCAVIY